MRTPPFAASAVNHRVPASDFSPALGDRGVSPTGKSPVYKQHRSLPCQLLQTPLYGSA
ncbi:unnamed protein product [Staurois parvus]|uniref:Uncharacterized protein n=1 Tax=Staurois parvus TaxID=386267 RepID=A0ABN9GLC6_9NEOB|nr:unnamed protein product [Staurois parvus]